MTYDEMAKQIGERLDRAIDEDGRTVVQIAEAASVARGSIYRLLQGKGGRLDTLHRVCTALGLDVGQVITAG